MHLQENNTEREKTISDHVDQNSYESTIKKTTRNNSHSLKR